VEAGYMIIIRLAQQPRTADRKLATHPFGGQAPGLASPRAACEAQVKPIVVNSLANAANFTPDVVNVSLRELVDAREASDTGSELRDDVRGQINVRNLVADYMSRVSCTREKAYSETT